MNYSKFFFSNFDKMDIRSDGNDIILQSWKSRNVSINPNREFSIIFSFENFSSQPNQSNETIGKDDATTQLLLWRLR